METKNLYVVLSRSNTVLSSLIHIVKEDEYTHASLALDNNLECMFSFGRRYVNNPFFGGFKRERLDEGLYARHKSLPGVIIELGVTDEEYSKATNIVGEFFFNEGRYDYNYLGLITSMLGVVSHSRDSFLCSEFVYYVLNQCGICDLSIPRNLVRPQTLLSIGGRVLFEGNLKEYTGCQMVSRGSFCEPLKLKASTV